MGLSPLRLSSSRLIGSGLIYQLSAVLDLGDSETSVDNYSWLPDQKRTKNLFSQSQHRPDIAIQNTENIPSQYACDQLLLDIALPGHVSGSKSGNLYHPDNNQEARNLVGQ
jgi:hypothetical protein